MKRWSLALVFVLALPALAQAEEAVLDTVGAKDLTGTLAGIDGKGTLVFRTGKDGEKKLAAADVIRLRLSRGKAKALAEDVEVVLHNGDRLYGSITGAAGEGQELVFRERSVGPLRIDIGLVRWIRFPGGRSLVLAPEEGKGEDKDYVFRKNGDRISGSIDSFSAEGVTIVRSREKTSIAFTDLQGLYIAPLDAVEPMEGVYAILRLKDGGRLSARILGYGEGIFTLELVEGMVRHGAGGKTNPDVAREEVVEFSYRNGNFVFLSDRTPASIHEAPWFENPPRVFKPPFGRFGPRKYRKDRSYDGNPLRLAGRRFYKGVGANPWCRIDYGLDGAFARFEALVGVDDEVLVRAEKGSVVFRVLVDGKETWKSPVLKGGMKPVPVSVDLAGAKVLSLVVDYAGSYVDFEDDHVNDHGDWADALLIKKK